MKNPRQHKAFTLIELSIVLVVIGLLVGGVLVGRDLIAAAAVRAQISQIEKYQTAVNTFKGKYDVLPGDLSSNLAIQFGFVTRAGTAGRGDGNGIIEGYSYSNGNTYGWGQTGEPTFFWADLSKAQLIDGSFTSVTDALYTTTGAGVARYIPSAPALSADNFVYTFSACQNSPAACFTLSGGINYFGLSKFTAIGVLPLVTDGALTVRQAFTIDSKIDDGIPNNGRVMAAYTWGSGATSIGWAPNAGSSTISTCFDSTNQYSIAINNGNNSNCALSFKFQ